MWRSIMHAGLKAIPGPGMPPLGLLALAYMSSCSTCCSAADSRLDISQSSASNMVQQHVFWSEGSPWARHACSWVGNLALHELVKHLLLLHRTGPMSSCSHSKTGIGSPRVPPVECPFSGQRPPSVLVLIAASVLVHSMACAHGSHPLVPLKDQMCYLGEESAQLKQLPTLCLSSSLPLSLVRCLASFTAEPQVLAPRSRAAKSPAEGAPSAWALFMGASMVVTCTANQVGCWIEQALYV